MTADIKGAIYIATMESVHGRLKIGYTDRTTTEGCEKRIKEWQQGTGVPGKAQLEYAAFVDSDPQRIESTVHRALKSHRADHNRRSEWFEIKIESAIKTVFEVSDKRLVREYINSKSELTSEHAINILRKQEREKAERERLKIRAIELQKQQEEERSRKAHQDYLNSPEYHKHQAERKAERKAYEIGKKFYEDRKRRFKFIGSIFGVSWMCTGGGSLIAILINPEINLWIFVPIYTVSLFTILTLIEEKWIEAVNPDNSFRSKRIVECTTCKKKNRVPVDSSIVNVRCGLCKMALTL